MLSVEEISRRFVAHYQPIVDICTGALVGFEALARKLEPDGSAVPAGELLEQIEEDRERLGALIRSILISIGRDVIPLFVKYPNFYVSVNIPPMVVGSGLLRKFTQDLHLEPYIGRLVCELTERQALTDTGRSALAAARAYGVRIAVDDFGTGNSGILQMAGLELDILKIDRSLVLPVLTSRLSARLLRGIVALASALHTRTIAEGVETWEQAFFMQAAGIDYGQGWFWSKALPPEKVEAALITGFPRPARP